MDNLGDLFPKDVSVVIDRERQLRLCVAGWRFLEDIYGDMTGVLRVVDNLREPMERAFGDLLHLLYACLLDAEGRSPLSVPDLQALHDQGADWITWRNAVLEAIANFFPAKPPEKKSTKPWSWAWAAWFVRGVCGRSHTEFMGMTIREIGALAQGRAMDMEPESAGDGPPKGRPVTFADFGPDGKFHPRKEG